MHPKQRQLKEEVPGVFSLHIICPLEIHLDPLKETRPSSSIPSFSKAAAVSVPVGPGNRLAAMKSAFKV